MIKANNINRHSIFFAKFENFLVRCGGKEQVGDSIVKALAFVARFSKKSSTWLLWCLFKKLHTRVEFRTIFLKGRDQYFPFFLRKTRSTFLITKLLMHGIKSIKTNRVTIKNGMAIEISRLCIIKAKNKQVFKKKKKQTKSKFKDLVMAQRAENVDKVIKGKAKMHYRW